MSTRWDFKNNINISNRKFLKIYRFYVIETPVRGVSVRGKTFTERNCNLSELVRLLKKQSPFLSSCWYDKPQKEIEATCKALGIFDVVNFDKEIAIHTINQKIIDPESALKLHHGKAESLFYAIRCAFAHGAFALHKYKGENYYVLENKDNGKLKGRLIIKENTLLSWIDLIETHYPIA